jgi:hypothetical protein
MPLPPDAASLEPYVHEAAKALGIPVDLAWTRAVAENLRRLLEAGEVLEQSGLCDAEPVIRYEP